MEQAREAAPEQVLQFWFGPTDPEGCSSPEFSSRWYKKSQAFDAEVKRSFESTYDDIAAGRLDGWHGEPLGWLASVVVLDQFSRNMFRDTAKMYSADPLAQRFASEGIGQGLDQVLKGHQRAFAYMPLMHSENLADQERCVELFQHALEQASPATHPIFSMNLKYAISHRDIVKKWGRFPHRNEILSRSSTEEEIAFLKTPGSRF